MKVMTTVQQAQNNDSGISSPLNDPEQTIPLPGMDENERLKQENDQEMRRRTMPGIEWRKWEEVLQLRLQCLTIQQK